MSTTEIITKEQLLNHWLAHRNLTRRTIEAFPEKELFEYQIGGMRTFAELAKEMINIALPSVQSIASKEESPFNHSLSIGSKQELLQKWDEDTPKIIEYYNQISEERFGDKHKIFGQFEFTIINLILYCIENEVHHRGQGYVYLRSLGIEPPPFWDRY